jgi:hypothetical protein
MPKIHLRVIRSGNLDSLDVFIKTIQTAFGDEVLKKDLTAIEKNVLNAAETTINQNRKRDLKRHTRLITVLRKSTDIEQMSKNRFRLGIGGKGYLQANAPYWYVLNYGHTTASSSPYIPPPMLGYFGRGRRPIKGVGKEIFHANLSNPFSKNPYGGGRVWQMVPGTPITPIHYLQAMAIALQKDMAALAIVCKKRAKEAFQKAKHSSKKETVTLTKTQLNLLTSKGVDTSQYSGKVLSNMLRYFSK